MKSVAKLTRRFVGILSLSMFLLLAVNFILLLVIASNQTPGIGPWTEQYVRMRALGDADAFCGTDLVLRRTAERLGGGPLDPTGAEFAPWRTYAAHHLWRAAQLHRG